MRQFYISDSKLFELDMNDFDFRLYEYLCKNYDLKRLTPFVRMIDCSDKFSTPLPKIKESLQRLSLMHIDYKPLISHKNFTYFNMPRYKYFLESIKFRKNYSRAGWSKLKQNVSSYQNGAYDN